MTNYIALRKNIFVFGKYKLVPIRHEDRHKIMKWRNEQMYHLRQSQKLTREKQDKYFEEVISELFDQDKPDQILFSYLENENCIGYGGLVHINWIDRNAEISFIMATELEKECFQFHWQKYLGLIEQAAFKTLGLHKIYTYAFDLRPQLYQAVEGLNYNREAILRRHTHFGGKYIDIVIHSKFSPYVLRPIKKEDEKIIYNWVNDSDTRLNSFNSDPVSFKDHTSWYQTKLNNPSVDYYMCYYQEIKSGIVRFDLKKNISVIGINISPEQRGKGLSSVFLNLSIISHLQKYKSQTILAYIKPENEASKRAFKKAGFSSFSEKVINNKAALIYKYKKDE